MTNKCIEINFLKSMSYSNSNSNRNCRLNILINFDYNRFIMLYIVYILAPVDSKMTVFRSIIDMRKQY